MPAAGGRIHCVSKINKRHLHCNLPITLQSQKRSKNLSHLVLTLHSDSKHPFAFLGKEMKEGIGYFLKKKKNLILHKLFLWFGFGFYCCFLLNGIRHAVANNDLKCIFSAQA